VSIAIRHPVPLCGVCKNRSKGLSAGGRPITIQVGPISHPWRSTKVANKQ
jgi:hypothetical protein